MGLKKTIIQSNGIPLNYHRIGNITNVVNDKTYINVISYVNNQEREKEKTIFKNHPFRHEIYRVYSSEVIDYNDTLTITSAYEYLKTIEKYTGAEDVYEVNENEKQEEKESDK